MFRFPRIPQVMFNQDSGGGAGGNAPAGDPPQQQPSTDGNQGDPQDDGDQPLSLAEARKLRKEHATLRARLKEFEDAKAKADEASLSEGERLKKQLADATSQHDAYRQTMQERFVNQTIQLEAQRLGIVDPDAAAKLLDWAELEFDDDGVPTNTAKVLAALVKARPYLAGKPTAISAGGASNPSRSATRAQGGWDLQRYQELVKTPGAYQALTASEKAELQNWLATQRR